MKTLNLIICCAFALATWQNTQAQNSEQSNDSVIKSPQRNVQISENLHLSGYLETYYAYDFGNPSDHTRPTFLYSFNRHNEVSLNFGVIQLAYGSENIRANLALMTGTYANTNLSAEPGVLKNIYEANAGMKLSKNKNLWLDAGIFPSHIGFESAIGKVCPTLARSILAENSPYFESGVKVSYTSNNEKWFISGLILNGWQRMQRIDGNNTRAFGHQLTYHPNAQITLNSSSYIGNEYADSVKKMRYFHNFFAQIQMAEKLALTLGFDMGAQQKASGDKHYDLWYAPVLILSYLPSEKINIAGRVEYYSDENQVMISALVPGGLQVYGYSLNFDYHISDNLVARFEGRYLEGKDKTFTFNHELSRTNFALTTSLAISF